jgi:hypothetical protein
VTYRQNEWRNEHGPIRWNPWALRKLWKMKKGAMRVSTPSPPLQVPGGLALSDSENAEARADSLWGSV